MKNELSKRKPRNALAVGYVGPQGFTEGARAHMRAPTMDDVRKGAEIADMSFLPGISDAAAGVLAVDEARKGNWGAAGLNALGVLPFVPALGAVVNGYGKTAQQMADALNGKHSALDAVLMDAPGGNVSLSKVVVPKDAREAGMGSAFMGDLARLADEQGVTLSLTPSSDFGGNKGRLREFYKRFGFVENKGRKKDFAISDAMHREAKK